MSFPSLPAFTRRIPHLRSLAAVGLLTAGALLMAAIGLFLIRTSAHLYLVWNLVLALAPLGFALATHAASLAGRTRVATATTALWLLFLPNAPYLLTDFIHLRVTPGHLAWGHLLLLVWFSLTGLSAGLLSVRIVHGTVTRHLGTLAGWAFVATTSMLAGVGVGLGRFSRWNSWDILHAPGDILVDALRRMVPGHAPIAQVLLPWVLGAFFGLAYLACWCHAADGTGTQSASPSDFGSGRKKESRNPAT